MEYIFLAGIHGVGKSTLGSKLKDNLDIKSISVSDLIRRAGNKFNTSSKNTTGIPHNQALWKAELNQLEIKETTLLLDGHFCLLNNENKIFSLPFSTFDNTKMNSIVLMRCSPQVIKERLYNRDNINYSIELLSKLQECEIEQVFKYSEIKKLGLFIYDESEPFPELINFIKGKGE